MYLLWCGGTRRNAACFVAVVLLFGPCASRRSKSFRLHHLCSTKYRIAATTPHIVCSVLVCSPIDLLLVQSITKNEESVAIFTISSFMYVGFPYKNPRAFRLSYDPLAAQFSFLPTIGHTSFAVWSSWCIVARRSPPDFPTGHFLDSALRRPDVSLIILSFAHSFCYAMLLLPPYYSSGHAPI